MDSNKLINLFWCFECGGVVGIDVDFIVQEDETEEVICKVCHTPDIQDLSEYIRELHEDMAGMMNKIEILEKEK